MNAKQNLPHPEELVKGSFSRRFQTGCAGIEPGLVSATEAPLQARGAVLVAFAQINDLVGTIPGHSPKFREHSRWNAGCIERESHPHCRFL